MTLDPARTAELAGNLARVRARIEAACAAAGRDPGEITLVAVTKTYPASDVSILAELGVTEIGENRVQEATAKAAQVAQAGTEVRWHFVGRLQRNKARLVVRFAELVHAVDSDRLAEALGAAAAARDRPLEVLIQVSIDADPARGGVPIAGLRQLAETVAKQPTLVLRGLMAVAPRSWAPTEAFARLAAAAAALRSDHPAATVLSAGMSGDLEAAIAQGATHLRVGSALLGMRAPLR